MAVSSSTSPAERYLFPILSISVVSIILLLSAISGLTASSFFLSSRLPSPSTLLLLRRGPHHLPSFAYLITGSSGDSPQILRLLLAVYHPRNRYLLHLPPDASDSERTLLALSVRAALPAARAFENVDVVGRPDAVTKMGTAPLAATLRAAAAMLRLDGGWDWFVTLSAKDYPLVTQDGKYLLKLVYCKSSVNLTLTSRSRMLCWSLSGCLGFWVSYS